MMNFETGTSNPAATATPANGHRPPLLFRPEDWQVRRPAPDAPTATVADALLQAGLLMAAGLGWLGLLLAQTGRFAPRNLLAVAFLATMGLAGVRFWHHRRLPQRPRLTWPDVAVVALLVLAWRVYTPPTDYALAALDAGWYANTGTLIARTGHLSVRPEAFVALPPEQRRLFVWSYHDVRRVLPQFPDLNTFGFYDVAFAIDSTADGRVGPFHPPGFSVWVAILEALGGAGRGPYAAPLFGLLFVLAVYGVARTAFDPRVGLVAAFLTAITPPVVYYSRTPFAEVAVGALLWGGGYALTRYRHHGQALDGLLAGLAFGMALHTKIESWLLLPLVLLSLALRFTPRPTRQPVNQPSSHQPSTHQPSSHQPSTHQPSSHLAILLPLVLLAAHAVLLGATILRPYLVLNGYGVAQALRTALARPAVALAMAGLAVGGGLLRHLARGRDLHPALAFGALAMGAGLLLMARGSSSGPLNGLVGFVTPLGVALAVLGITRLIRCGLPRGARTWAVIAAVWGLFPLAMPLITQTVSPLYAVRRQVPVVIPALWVLAAYGLVEMPSQMLAWFTLRRPPISPKAERPRLRGTKPFGLSDSTPQGPGDGNPALSAPDGLSPTMRLHRWVAWALALGLLLAVVVPLVQLDRRLPEGELAGSSAFVAELAARFRPDDVVLFEGVAQGSHVGRFAAPLWARYGVQALVLGVTPPPAELLTATIATWERQGRRVFLVSKSDPPPFAPPGRRWELVERLTWVGSMVATTDRFPPASKSLPVSFYLYKATSDVIR